MAKFKTRARAVDMLGRQQIAGIPTAISELFKNAHDAYADRVEVDYYRSDSLFVLRDDGIGMTQDEFESRWLTLGTESKVGGKKGLKPPYVPPDKELRPTMGEKGIGRLAIAAIGPQLFILTRALRDDGLHDLVAAYIHWGIFELPGLDLEDIEIPIEIFPNGSMPSNADVRKMIEVFRKTVLNHKDYLSDEEIQRFENDFEKVASLDPAEVDQFVPSLNLSGKGYGTHFVIMPAYDIIQDDIDNEADDKASSLIKALLGFTNTMTPDAEEPVIRTAFRDHKFEDLVDDLIEENQFFTPEEFKIADHHISGEFDEFGQFRGNIVVYDKTYNEHLINWSGGQGRMTECGSVKINLAIVQGTERESKLSTSEFAGLINKTRKLGGLYIYKDGIRILPYGNNDFDWLDIEKRRTKSASYYYFSHRNIFGILEIDKKNNSELKEKAGREGFRENKAYRQLREILKNFFVQIAADFFREEGIYGEGFVREKAELNRLELARRQRESQVNVKKKRLAEELDKFFSRLDSGEPEKEAFALAEKVQTQIKQASSISDTKLAAKQILQLEVVARNSLRELEEKFKVNKPKGVGLGQKLSREFINYETAYIKLQSDTFAVVKNLVEGEVTEIAKSAKLELDRRLRIEYTLKDLSEQARRAGKAESSETREILEKVNEEIRAVTKGSITEIDSTIRKVLTDFERIDFYSMEDKKLIDTRDLLENRIIIVKEKEQEFLRYVRSQLEAIKLDGSSSQLEQLEAIEQRNISLEERADMDLQLSQLGMAIEIINHEFESSIKGIRNGLRRLKGWVDLNEEMDSVYANIKNNFEHLDGYLTLFTPLHRRLYRNAIEIKGFEIRNYVSDLFRQRFERHKIELRATKSFSSTKFMGYPSSFYPVFINIIDNAIFWLRDLPSLRIIQLNADETGFYISNNGPKIPERNLETVFEHGVSYKPGGRGLGLFISREVLDKVGYNLILDKPEKNMTVTFKISSK